MLLPYLNKDLIEAGGDEAGRGCLAGSVSVSYTHLDVYKRQHPYFGRYRLFYKDRMHR